MDNNIRYLIYMGVVLPFITFLNCALIIYMFHPSVFSNGSSNGSGSGNGGQGAPFTIKTFFLSSLLLTVLEFVKMILMVVLCIGGMAFIFLVTMQMNLKGRTNRHIKPLRTQKKKRHHHRNRHRKNHHHHHKHHNHGYEQLNSQDEEDDKYDDHYGLICGTDYVDDNNNETINGSSRRRSPAPQLSPTISPIQPYGATVAGSSPHFAAKEIVKQGLSDARTFISDFASGIFNGDRKSASPTSQNPGGASKSRERLKRNVYFDNGSFSDSHFDDALRDVEGEPCFCFPFFEPGLNYLEKRLKRNLFCTMAVVVLFFLTLFIVGSIGLSTLWFYVCTWSITGFRVVDLAGSFKASGYMFLLNSAIMGIIFVVAKLVDDKIFEIARTIKNEPLCCCWWWLGFSTVHRTVLSGELDEVEHYEEKHQTRLILSRPPESSSSDSEGAPDIEQLKSMNIYANDGASM